VDTDGAQETFDALETQAVVIGEGGGGGAFAVGGDEVGDVPLIEAVTTGARGSALEWVRVR
jgi:hypothetical protein